MPGFEGRLLVRSSHQPLCFSKILWLLTSSRYSISAIDFDLDQSSYKVDLHKSARRRTFEQWGVCRSSLYVTAKEDGEDVWQRQLMLTRIEMQVSRCRLIG